MASPPAFTRSGGVLDHRHDPPRLRRCHGGDERTRGIEVSIDYANQDVDLGDRSSGTVMGRSSATLEADTWYWVRVNTSSNGTRHSVTVYDERGGSAVASVTGSYDGPTGTATEWRYGWWNLDSTGYVDGLQVLEAAGNETVESARISRSIDLSTRYDVPSQLIAFQVNASVSASGAAGDAQLVVETPDGNRTVVLSANTTAAGEVDETGPSVGYVNLSRFGDQQVTLAAEARGNASVAIHGYRYAVYSDEDALSDNVEAADCLPYFLGCTRTNPFLFDSDYDGLADPGELGDRRTFPVVGTDVTIELYEATSFPNTADSDGDLVDDDTERVWESDPRDRDTDDDGYYDLRDPDHTVDNTPVSFSARSYGWNQRIVVTDVAGGEIEDISVTAHYSPQSPFSSPFWDSDAGTWIDFEAPLADWEKRVLGSREVNDGGWEWPDHVGREYIVEHSQLRADDEHVIYVDQHGWNDEAPDRYYVNVTDAAGNTVEYEVVPDGANSASARVTTAGFTLAGVATVGTPGIPADEAVIVGGTIGLAALVGIVEEGGVLGTDGTSIEERQFHRRLLPLSGVVATYPASETVFEEPLELPSGNRYEAPEQFGDGHDRVYGREHVVHLPGVTHRNAEETIEEILRAPSAVYRDGDYRVVVGDNPRGSGDIALWRDLGGTLLVASQLIEDPQGNKVEIDRTDRHPVQEDESHPDSYDEIERAIRNPDEIWETAVGGKAVRFYVKNINGRWLVVRTAFEGRWWTIGTAVYEGQSYVGDVIDLLKRKGFDVPGDRKYP